MPAVVVGALLLALGTVPGTLADASARSPAPGPKCTAFSTHKISDLVEVGKLYFSNSLARGTSCFYYGIPPAQANKLATKAVPFQQIKYVASLQISVLPTTKSLFGLQKRLLQRGAAKQGLEFDAVDRKLRLGSEEYFFSGEVTSNGEMPCDPMIMYDNWTGPPSCVGEPPLKKVGVLAWIGGNGTGQMINVAAAAQPPARLSISHMLELARETIDGKLLPARRR
jgi:hypothetical protein